MKRGANRAFPAGLLLAAGLALATPLPALSESPSTRAARDQYKDWAKGPVRYLITRTESRLFRRLKTPQQRLDFIRRFWERRDPNRVTPLNEARVAYWQRVQEANRRFSPESAEPGWKTDQGKIFILLGPPDDIEKDENFDTGIREIANRGLTRWIYYGLEKSSTRAITVVPFIRNNGNEWELTPEARFADPAFNIYGDPQAQYANDLAALGGLGAHVDDLPWTRGTLGTAMDLGRLQEVPTERDLMQTVVKAEDFIGNLDARVITHALSTAGTTPVLALTLAVRQDALFPGFEGSAAELAHRFLGSATLVGEGVGGDASVIEVPEEAFVAEPRPGSGGDGWLRIQALSIVPPGRWNISAVLLDRGGSGAGVIESVVEVPRRDPARPRIDGPLVATSLSISGGSGREGDRPFVIADAIVTPRIEGPIAQDEPFAVFLHVLPAAGSEAPVAMDWSIRRKAPGSETFESFGKPGRSEDARGPRGWEFKAGQFAPGTYEIVFTASQEGRESETRSLVFEVVAPENALAE